MQCSFSNNSPGCAASFGLLALRAVMGSAFVFHGWPKIQNPLGWMGPDSPVPAALQAAAACSEFGGGALLIIGFLTRLAGLGIREIVTAPQSPWQNPYAERVIGSIRRECLDHLIILGENHLRGILREYVRYYNKSRPHLSLERNAPVPRSVEPSELGAVVAVPQVGGLHHLYTRAA